MRFSTSEVARATGGEVFGREAEVDGVTIDSRSVPAGALFVPIVAERDGHEFIGAAVQAGASAYLTAGPIEAATAIRVVDTTVALTALGGHARGRLPDRVVGVTGSVGKTSLKDILASVGATTWRTSVSVGSFNNELGVPLTLANAADGAELVVVEMGARGIGHIEHLCQIARPTVGIVTSVAGAHLEQFGSLDGVAAAKGELVEALSSSGTAVLNADDHRVAAMASRTDAQVIRFGLEAGDVRAEGIVVDRALRPSFVMQTPWGRADVKLGVAGRHQVSNALGAAAAALALGAELEAVAEGLAAARLSAMRMDVRTLDGGALLINDSYNANPTSMRAALAALADVDASRRYAVLGTMAELGAEADEAHREILRYASDLGITTVTVAEPRYRSDPESTVEDVESAVEWLRAQGIGDGDAVLVKASRAARLERVVGELETSV